MLLLLLMLLSLLLLSHICSGCSNNFRRRTCLIRNSWMCVCRCRCCVYVVCSCSVCVNCLIRNSRMCVCVCVGVGVMCMLCAAVVCVYAAGAVFVFVCAFEWLSECLYMYCIRVCLCVSVFSIVFFSFCCLLRVRGTASGGGGNVAWRQLRQSQSPQSTRVWPWANSYATYHTTCTWADPVDWSCQREKRRRIRWVRRMIIRIIRSRIRIRRKHQ